MKYKLINRQTGEGYLCDKVEMNGFDYYISDITYVNSGDLFYNTFDKVIEISKNTQQSYWINKAIATTNPNIDAPQVVDEVEELAISYEKSFTDNGVTIKADFKAGYNKSQETHPFSEEDVRFMLSEAFKASQEGYQITADEIIQIWKEQPKVIYYNTIKQ